MPRPIRARVSHSAIRHNLGLVRAHAPSARIWAVVKANAYGHGLEHVLPACAAADGLAMLDLAEAVRCRDAGYRGPILLLEGVFCAQDLALVEALGLTIAVHVLEQIEMLEHTPVSAPIAVYLKVNTGMNRLGFAPSQAHAMYQRLRAMPKVGAITLMTHFAHAESEHGVDAALALFAQATAGLPGERSTANSAATLLHRGAQSDWVRPGIMLYGASPADPPSADHFGLRAAMTLESQLIAIQEVGAGSAVGYGGRFVTTRASRIGVVACGYADGYPRIARDGTPVLVEGLRAGLAGRVSMDMMTVDVTAIPQARVGSPVELWGSRLRVDEVAEHADTTGYELLCAVAPRVPMQAVD